MGSSVAIVISGALIALAVLITNHWQLQALGSGDVEFLRLNRWAGTVDVSLREALAAQIEGIVNPQDNVLPMQQRV
jgi:hypothetical protein